MANFAYTARDISGKKIKGQLLADDRIYLKRELAKLGLFLISAQETKATKSAKVYGKVTRKDIITFTIYVQTMISSGVPLMTALKQIEEQAENPVLKKVVGKVHEELAAGQSISEAMSHHPKVFNDLYVSVIQAGEASGKLEEVLQDLADFLEWQHDLTVMVKSAITYPVMLIGMSGSLVSVLVFFVFPTFMKVFEGFDMELPLPTRVMIAVNTGIKTYGYYVVGSIALLAVSFYLVSHNKKGRLLLDKYKLHLPVIGQVISKVCISRFAHYLSLLLRSGIDIAQSLSIVEKLVGNAAIAKVVATIRELILGGVSISQSMGKFEEFPPLVLQMISVGEMSGKLEENLNKVSRFYDKEIPEAINKSLGMIQPIVILLMGGMILFIALGIFLPLYSMSSAIK